MASFLTDRKRALGLGSSRSGTHHHWEMMVSSILVGFMIPAFLITFVIGYNRPYDEVAAYFGQPVPALVMAGSLIVIVRHLMAETVVAVEDYVHGVIGKLTQVAVKSISYTLIAIGLFALARLAF